jgi:aminotransferase
MKIMKDSRSPRKGIARSVQSIRPSGIRDFFEIVSSMEDTISLGVGEPGYASPWHIRDSAVYALERGATSYTSNLGLEELRKALSGYVEGFFGPTYDPATEILVTTGVSEGLDLAIRAIVDPGDEIIYHQPSYVSYEPTIQLSHGIPTVVETRASEGFEIEPDALEAKITPKTKAIVLNYPNNPTGAALSREKLERLAALALQHDLIVITDEIYAELTYDDRHKSIASLPGMRDRTILLHGFSKAWAMTGFRIGYCCAPRELTQAMTTIHQYTMLCAPTLSQVAAIEALAKPEWDLEEARSRYRLNRNLMCQSFSDMGLPCHLPQGAFYAFPYTGDVVMTSKDFALELLEKEKVAVVPGNAFGPCGEGFVRCCFATSREDIKTAMERMAAFVSHTRKTAIPRSEIANHS